MGYKDLGGTRALHHINLDFRGTCLSNLFHV